MGRCYIKSKNDEEYHLKFVDFLDNIHFKPLYMLGINLLKHISLKKEPISMSAPYIPFENKSSKTVE